MDCGGEGGAEGAGDEGRGLRMGGEDGNSRFRPLGAGERFLEDGGGLNVAVCGNETGSSGFVWGAGAATRGPRVCGRGPLSF